MKDRFTEETLSAVVARDQPFIVYCSGVKCSRSYRAAARAVKWGFTRVIYFRGGIVDWRDAGLPMDKVETPAKVVVLIGYVFGGALRWRAEIAVQRVRKGLAVGCRERRGAAAGQSTGPHGVEKVPDIQTLADVVRGENLAAWAQCLALFVDHLGGQRYIGGDHQVVFFHAPDNFVVGDIKTR